jgi:hypothetical protein
LIINLEETLNIDPKPSSNDKTNKLDKASILRETALFLKKHQNSKKLYWNYFILKKEKII